MDNSLKVFYCNLVHLVTCSELDNCIHAPDYLAKNRIIPIKEWYFLEGNVKLAAGGIQVTLPAGHGYSPFKVLMGVNLSLDGISGAAHPITLGVSPWITKPGS